MIGNGNPNGVTTFTMQFADDEMPCLALNYSLGQIAGESATVRPSRATFAVDANGGADDTFILMTVTLKRYDNDGDALDDITYALSGVAAGGKVDWDGADATGWTAKASTLKEAIDLLNEIPGIQAYAMHAPHAMCLGCDDFIDVTTVDIPTQPGKYLETVYRDVSEYKSMGLSGRIAYMRVGLPELRDAGKMKLLKVRGTLTGITATTSTLRIYRDDIRDYSKEYDSTYADEMANKQMYLNAVAVAANTSYLDDTILDASTIQGPIIVEAAESGGDALTAANLDVVVAPANL